MRVAQPRELGSLFVASYDSQGSSGGILTRLHMGKEQVKVKVKVKATLRPTISRQARHGVRRPSGTRDQFFFLFEIFF
jgi:hypothetical protein